MAYYYNTGVIVPFVQKFYKQMIVVVAGLFIASMAAMTLSASAATTVIYDSIPEPLPSNLSSLGHEAYSAKEIGNRISFATTERDVTSAEITMSSWACQTGEWSLGNCASAVGSTFSHPVTLNIYNVNGDGSVGSVISSVTQTFEMQYRPSANPGCSGGRWMDGSGSCFNGKAFTIKFDLSSIPTLPNEIVYGVAYNTQSHGYAPLNVAGPYNSLNVALNTEAPYTGTDVTPGTIYWNTTAAFDGNGTFSPNTGWGNLTVAARFITGKAPVVLANKDACKNGGWATSELPVFKNQGQCVSHFASKGVSTTNRTKNQ